MAEKKVVSIEDRIPKLKQARKKKANRRLIFYLSLFFILIGLVGYLQSPLSRVHTIEVSGNNYVDEEDIIDLSGLSTSQNYFSVNTDEVESKVKKHLEIEKVSVSRKFPSTIIISVEEFSRIAYIQEDNDFYPLLENGATLKSYPLETMPGDAPLLVNFTKQTYLQEMTKELSELPSSITNLISEVHWQPSEGNPYKVWLFMSDGFEVDGSIRNFANTMKAYPSISAQLDRSTKGVIRMADGGAVFDPYENIEKQGNDGENEDEVEG
ncbi:cell division protein FtsQ/DivIB [Aquibacillus salsiterrae]|uniref:Cell division protein DivIB n=1 Tax=Aquibacillus salsiterrae TaxID=2950439 RepID=A0A9X3WD30_9BACI|nr:cell division protein FtsQ/DivIB [Aquibacillus salsiterrae]MDC3416478.1 cell division protein FtsQ/DivIB [Aquibacillus salsiterrae]